MDIARNPAHARHAPILTIAACALAMALADLGLGRLRAASPEIDQTGLGPTTGAWGVVRSLDGRWIAHGTVDTTVRLWDAPTSLIRIRWSVVLRPDGGWFAGGSVKTRTRPTPK